MISTYSSKTCSASIEMLVTRGGAKVWCHAYLNAGGKHDGWVWSLPWHALIKSEWWFGTCCMFPYIGNVIIPIDEMIFFRGVGQPPTRLMIQFFEFLWSTNDYKGWFALLVGFRPIGIEMIHSRAANFGHVWLLPAGQRGCKDLWLLSFLAQRIVAHQVKHTNHASRVHLVGKMMIDQ